MEELRESLLWASPELEQAWDSAEAQRQLQEARLLHLQELLIATRKERDEAQEQLLKLEVEYSNMVTNNLQSITSSDLSQWPNTELDVLNPSTMPSPFHCFPNSDCSQLVGLGDQHCWNSTPAHHFHQRTDVDLHRPPTSYSNLGCSNVKELKDEPFYHHEEQQLCLVDRQESEQWQQVESHLVTSPLSVNGCTPAAMPAHLSERAEAELLLRQSDLPERGKLLQAVMQAGPLLQTLLLTGPLPQWKNPPPVSDSLEIPRISLCSSPNSPLPVGPLVHHLRSSPDPADPLRVNSALFFSCNSLCSRPITDKFPTAPCITSRQSSSAATSRSSKKLSAAVLNSMDSAMTADLPLKFAKIY